MVSSTTTLSTARIIQWIMAAIILGLSGKITNDKNSLSTIIDDINELSNSFNFTTTTTTTTTPISISLLQKRDDDDDDGQYVDVLISGDLNIVTGWKSSAISMSSSSYNLISHPLLSYAPYFFTDEGLIKTAQASTSVFSKKELLYLGLTSGSELSLNVLYFASFVYEVSQIGSMNCNNFEKLLNGYNLSNNQDYYYVKQQQQIYYNTSDEIDELTNSTLVDLQLKLYSQLSSNCQLKKASIAINFINWCIFVMTTGNVSMNALSLYNKWHRNLKQSKEENKKSTILKLKYFANINFPILLLNDDVDVDVVTDDEYTDTVSQMINGDIL